MKINTKSKFFFWAIIVFGTLGVYVPIAIRVLQLESNIFIYDEIIMNLTTYSVSVLTSSIYIIILKSADSSDEYKNKIFDNIGYIIGSIVFVIIINFLITISTNRLAYWGAILFTLIGCSVAWRIWYKANSEDDFGTGSLGH